MTWRAVSAHLWRSARRLPTCPSHRDTSCPGENRRYPDPGYVVQILLFLAPTGLVAAESVALKRVAIIAFSVELRVLHTVPAGVARTCVCHRYFRYSCYISNIYRDAGVQMPVIFVQHLPENSRNLPQTQRSFVA